MMHPIVEHALGKGDTTMDYSKYKYEALTLVEQVAPLIGQALGGVSGFAATYIIPILAHAFNAQPNNLGQLFKNILADPEASLKLNDISQTHTHALVDMLGTVRHPTKVDLHVVLQWDAKD